MNLCDTKHQPVHLLKEVIILCYFKKQDVYLLLEVIVLLYFKKQDVYLLPVIKTIYTWHLIQNAWPFTFRSVDTVTVPAWDHLFMVFQKSNERDCSMAISS